MRILTVALVILLSGCVSSQQPGSFREGFDRDDAAKTRVSLGLTYLKNGNYTQAKVNLDRALEYAPRSADVHYSLAYYYQLVGENERADEAYNTAIKLAPRNADIANSYGAFLCQIGDYESALDYFNKAINNKIYANSAATYENMALCAQDEGRIDDAIRYLNDALNHQPTRAKSLLLLAELYAKQNRWDEAKAILRKFERVGQVTPDYLMLAVDIAEGQGDLNTAKDYGEMLLAVYPTHPLAQQYRERQQKWPKISVSRKQKASPAAVIESSDDEGDVVQQRSQPVIVAESESVEPAPAAGEVKNAEVAVSADSQTPTASADERPVAQDSVDEDVSQNADVDSSEPVSTPRFHIVKASENLYRISLKYNIKLATLQEWNNIEDSGAIFAGKKLWLVPPEEQEE